MEPATAGQKAWIEIELKHYPELKESFQQECKDYVGYLAQRPTVEKSEGKAN